MNLSTFDFNEVAVRVMVREGEPWWVAADVCRALDIQNASDALKGLEEDEQATLDNSEGGGRAHRLNVISESGLYALIFKSRKVEAKQFRRWVTKEVLPAIRKSGAYQIPSSGLNATEEARVDRLITVLEELIGDRRAGRIDNGTASVLANLACQTLRAWDVKLRLRTPSPVLELEGTPAK